MDIDKNKNIYLNNNKKTRLSDILGFAPFDSKNCKTCN